MSTFTSRRFASAVLMAITVAGAAGALFVASSEPAAALCKYGTPHCVNPNPGPKLPKVGGAQIPGSGWEDPDCKYFRNCGYTGTPAVRSPTKHFTIPVRAVQAKRR